ncbi:MAG: PepSY domain-containing protein, partial [Pyrinomonadaceae bacterium]|nr:PepSY domain-containing protein [Sphingobacteriaceae bacterium]
MNITFGKGIYKVHKWSGLIAGVFIFIMGISGSILVFHDEIEKTGNHPYLTVDNTLPVNIDVAYK